MPSTYTHYKLGREVIEKLPADIKQVIIPNIELFHIGLHGPDILFYYKALKKNHVSRTGYHLHEQSGRSFFQNAAKIIVEHNENPAYLAYIYGVICHFALDVTCHGYIEYYIQTRGVTHAEIEVEFDRELLVLEGKDPIKTSIIKHLVPSLVNGEIIHQFYSNITAKEVRDGIKGTIMYNKLLLAPGKCKRNTLLFLLKLIGKYDEMQGLFMSYEKRESCIESTKKLLDYYPQAEQLAVQLLVEYLPYVRKEMELDRIYEHTFGGIVYTQEREGL